MYSVFPITCAYFILVSSSISDGHLGIASETDGDLFLWSDFITCVMHIELITMIMVELQLNP